MRISEVKRLNKARGKKRGLGSVDGAITLARQRDIERPMRGVRGGTAKSFLAASVLANALGGGGGGVGGETLTVSSNVLDTRGASVCVCCWTCYILGATTPIVGTFLRSGVLKISLTEG